MKEDTSWFKQSFPLNLNNVNITQLVGGWADGLFIIIFCCVLFVRGTLLVSSNDFVFVMMVIGP